MWSMVIVFSSLDGRRRPPICRIPAAVNTEPIRAVKREMAQMFNQEFTTMLVGCFGSYKMMRSSPTEGGELVP